MKRYGKDRYLAGGKKASAEGVPRIRKAIRLGLLSVSEIRIQESQRLDHLAHEHLGDSTLWWVLAATSDIGWGMQIPPGTIIRIPNNLSQIEALV